MAAGLFLCFSLMSHPKKLENVVALDRNSERSCWRPLGVVVGDGLDLGLVRLLGARDDSLTDEGVGVGEVGGVHGKWSSRWKRMVVRGGHRGHGVVCSVCPAPVAGVGGKLLGFPDRASIYIPPSQQSIAIPYRPGMGNGLVSQLSQNRFMHPSEV